jgi:glycosyltransferase involved in cell wall biosynthesis
MLNNIEIIVLSFLVVCLIVQLIFYWIVLAKPYYYLLSARKGKILFHSGQPPVSIIVCVKNNYYDVSQFLLSIMEQDYPQFEVIIVNDGNSDENEEVLMRLKSQYDNLYSTYIPEDTRNVSRKKLGLTLGIKAAKYEYLLFTEPDCHVRDNRWISFMSRHFKDKKTLILGFSAMKKEVGLFSKFREYDYFFSGLQMVSLALFKHPYSGSGRNLAYTKTHFNEQKGFVKHRILQQGEDDLFVNEIANGKNTAVEFSAQSLVIADINNYYDWKQLKIDRAVTKQFYHFGPVLLWRIESFFRIGFILSFSACLLAGYPYLELSDFLLPGIAVFCFFIRLISQLFVINNTAKGLKLNKFYFMLPFFDIIQPFLNIYFYIYRVFKGKQNYTYKYEKR